MSRLKRVGILAAVGAAAALTACAPINVTNATRSPTSTPSPTEEPFPAVSLQTSCNLLFGSDVDGPMADATDIISRFIEAPDLSTVTQTEIETTIESLDTARSSADESIRPYIEAQIEPLQQLLDALTTGKNSSVDFAEYKAGALELLNQCNPYL